VLMESLDRLMAKKPHLKEFLETYSLKDWIEEVFWE
jgi:hypothetical protein